MEPKSFARALSHFYLTFLEFSTHIKWKKSYVALTLTDSASALIRKEEVKDENETKE